jgi:hypothetical protein
LAKIRFTGRVLPSVVNVTISNHPTIVWRDEDGAASFAAHIKDGLVTVECDTERTDSEHITELYRRSIDIARASVDLVGFSRGLGLTVVLDEVIDEAGNKKDIVPSDLSLEALCDVFKLGDGTFDQVLRIVLSSPPLFFALRDLIETITLPHRAPTNCARAVETIRNLLTPNADRKLQWAALRNALNLDERYLRLITDQSTAPRHGDHGFIDGIVTVEITRRAWVIMNRFLAYRKSGNQPLSLIDFPLLA